MKRMHSNPSTGATYVEVQSLGSGQFGVAKAVKNRKGEMFCMKRVPVRGGVEEKQLVMQEASLMKETCDHPNIVSFFDSWFDQRTFCILMEHCSNGSLDKVIARFKMQKKRFPEKKIVHYMQELSGALKYCHHDLRIMHRDIKPANILIDDLGTLKLTDFGLAKSLQSAGDMCATFCGSPLYMSPEQCSGSEYSFSTDVWALGCVSFELMSLSSPWTRDGKEGYSEVVARIKEAKPNYSLLAKTYPSRLIEMTRCMLQEEAEKRWSASRISDHLEMRPPTLVEEVPSISYTGMTFPPPPPSSPILAREKTLFDKQTYAVKRIQISFRSSLKKKEEEKGTDRLDRIDLLAAPRGARRPPPPSRQRAKPIPPSLPSVRKVPFTARPAWV